MCEKAIANNMVTSATEIPHGWMMIEADATNLVKTRNYHKIVLKIMKAITLHSLLSLLKQSQKL